jgi:flavin reductase (DIM6/NTAB) family NADH-FMN oxidoreductase RutF
MMDPNEFRRVLGHFPSGVTIVTSAASDGAHCGLTVTAFCAVSLDPCLVLVCVERDSESHGCIAESGIFAISMLEGEQGELLSRRFSDYAAEDKFEGVSHHSVLTGAPVLENSIAWVDCRVTQQSAAGDHTIFIGEVLAGDAREGNPLVHYRGGYGTFEP